MGPHRETWTTQTTAFVSWDAAAASSQPAPKPPQPSCNLDCVHVPGSYSHSRHHSDFHAHSRPHLGRSAGITRPAAADKALQQGVCPCQHKMLGHHSTAILASRVPEPPRRVKVAFRLTATNNTHAATPLTCTTPGVMSMAPHSADHSPCCSTGLTWKRSRAAQSPSPGTLTAQLPQRLCPPASNSPAPEF